MPDAEVHRRWHAHALDERRRIGLRHVALEEHAAAEGRDRRVDPGRIAVKDAKSNRRLLQTLTSIVAGRRATCLQPA